MKNKGHYIFRKAREDEVEILTELSIAAFHTDYLVGGEKLDGPSGYDDVNWYFDMQKGGHLYTFQVDNKIIGGAVIFKDNNSIYIGRIFVDPLYHHQGYGITIMNAIESLDNTINSFYLDTPIVNTRTNAFYKKLGYVETSRDNECINYKKIK